MDLIIKNGKVVTAEKTFSADIGIKDGKIASVRKGLADSPAAQNAKIIDAKGMLVMPGAIDVHVHLNLFFCGTYSENWDTGTAAAAAGGVTTIIDYAIQQKGKTIKEAVEARMKDAESKVCIDYSLHGGITDWNNATRDELNDLTVNGGIPTFKMFMIYRKEGWMADDAILFQAFEETKKNGSMIMVHAESAFILELLIERYHTEEMMKKYGAYCHTLSRPCYTEEEAVARAIKWAGVTGGRLYIVHMSSGEAADAVKAGRLKKINVWAETCPQYLLLTDDVFKGEHGHYFATCPQIKKTHDRDRLWKGLSGGEIQVLATDTCCFNSQQKDMWAGDFTKIPYGLPGVETLLPTTYTAGVGKKRISINKLVSLLSTNPAKLFGLYPHKGTIAAGSDADIVIFDPNKKVVVDYKNLMTKCDWSPFQGMKLTGEPKTVISRGEIIAEDGKFTGKVGRGKFLKRKPGGKV
ncbi:MAG: dihydropyrimidinase [Elusimicrobiota bacterium]